MNRYKIAFVMICLNEPYWQYVKPCIDSLKKFCLKGHDVDFILWTDMLKEMGEKMGAKVIPTEPFQWPLPTLYRYHLFLRQEELLKEYDYIYYCDSDMLAVSRMGDEILGDLVAAEHPMYSIKQEYIPPYEPNEQSTAFIPRTGKIELTPAGKKRFKPLYLAGGLQGGRSENFIKAMKVMRDRIDEDFTKNGYIAIWNDESHWNKYCFENPPTVVLNPSYVYPDSLINQYYKPLWGRNYVPKLITITKKFSLSKEGGTNLQQILNQ
jgi:histo-blood group ABO system transferase